MCVGLNELTRQTFKMNKILKFPIQTKSLKHVLADYKLMLSQRKKERSK